MRKLRRNPKRLEEEKKEPVRKKTLYKRKKPVQCEYVNPKTGRRCQRQAFGKGNMCERHSSSKIKEDSGREAGLINSSSILTKYDPVNHPTLFIQLSGSGYSPQEIASGIGVSMDTIQQWRETYILFDEACKIGKTAYEGWFIAAGRRNLQNRDFQTALYKFLTMNNGLNWTDKVDSKSQVQGQFGVLLVPGEMGMDEWEQNNINSDAEMQKRIQENQNIVEPDYYEVQDNG